MDRCKIGGLAIHHPRSEAEEMRRSSPCPAPTPLAPETLSIASQLCEFNDTTSDPVDFKTCSACRLAKPLDHFAKNRAQRGGLDGQCRVCTKLRKAQAYRKNQSAKKSKRRPIACSRVLGVADLKVVKTLRPMPVEDYAQRLQNVIGLLIEGGAA